MKKPLKYLVVISTLFFTLNSYAQVPQGFTYQAVARDLNGDPLPNKSIQVKLSVKADSAGAAVIWEELHNPVTTDGYGIFSIILGRGARQVSSTVANFTAIDWSVSPKFLRSEVYYNGQWKFMGTTRLWSVPYALMAGDVTGPVDKLTVTGQTSNPDEALFEVRNKNGQIVFAVYSEGVRIYIDDGENVKGAKGGFAIGGFGTAKASSQEYFRVTRDSSRLSVNRAAKGSKGGFAIGGFDPTKGIPTDFFVLTPENYFIGDKSGSKTSGIYNSFMGYEAGMENTTGSSNVMIGYKTGRNSTSGNSNLFIGNEAGSSTTTGSGNVFLGTNSGNKNTTGLQNVFIGPRSGESNTEGEQNVFIGLASGALNTGGSMNIFLGAGSGYNNLSTIGNIFIGGFAGYSNTSGGSNIFIGRYSGYSSTGNSNVFIGESSGTSNTSGSSNVFLGSSSGIQNSTGNGNLFLGTASGNKNSTGYDNTYVGGGSGYNNIDGNRNTSVGGSAGSLAVTGSNNVFVGHSAGAKTEGSGNIMIGYRAGYNEIGSDKLYIDNSESDSNSALIYGEFNSDLIRLNGSVNIRDVLKLKPRSTAPLLPAEGDMYYDSTSHMLKVYDGTTWRNCW